MEPFVRPAVERALRSGWYVLGQEGEAFESEFSAYLGTKQAIGVANGTDALELGLRALGLNRGDSVALVANAGGYALTAVNSIGANVRFVDIDEETLLVDLDELEKTVSKDEVDVVVITHLFGRMVEMNRVMDLSDHYGFKVVEDCAQSHGAIHGGKRAGSFGHIGCFSFYPTKNLGAVGDAGAVATSDLATADLLRKLRQYGWSGKYRIAISDARNSRLDEVQAAVLRAKLPHLDHLNMRRRAIAKQYSEGIKNSRVVLPPPGSEDYVAHLYVVQTPQREELRKYLQEHAIATDIHYPVPDHRQAAFIEREQNLSLPVTERAAGQILTLPCFPELRDAEVQYIINSINAW